MKVASFDIGMRNMALCLVDHDGTPLHWEVTDVITEGGSRANARNLAASRVTALLVAYLRKRHPVLEQADLVVVENQPGRARFAQKVMQHVIVAYCQGLWPGVKVQHCSGSCKLRVCPEARGLPKMSTAVAGSGYRRNKNQACAMAEHLLEHWPREVAARGAWDSASKRDDLADSWLQALSCQAT